MLKTIPSRQRRGEDVWPSLKENRVELECVTPGLDSAQRDTKCGCLRRE
jgi:hypothetical protein